MVDNYQIFLTNLQAFINRYYKISLYKGLLLLVLSILLLLFSFATLEYFGWFSNNFRLFLFASFIITVLSVFIYFIVIPLFRLLGIFKGLSHKHAIFLISRSFPELNDLLINIYELHYLTTNRTGQELIRASLNQKIAKVKDFRFQDAVSKKPLTPLFYYLLSLLALYFLVFVLKPNMLTDGSRRILHYNQIYERDFGFSIQIDSSDLIFERGSSKEISIRILGDVYPEELFMEIGGKQFLLTKINNNQYTYNFKNVNQNFSFRLVNSYFQSKLFMISVLKVPVLKNIKVFNYFPQYLNRENNFSIDYTNLSIPFGTKVRFEVNLEFCDSLFFITDTDTLSFQKTSEFTIDLSPRKSTRFKLLAKNSKIKKVVLDGGLIQVTPDLYPDISVLTRSDSYQSQLVYFKGFVNDDYGFHNLEFTLNSPVKDTTINLPLNININSQEFTFVFDFSSYNIDQASYHFTIYDNDALHFFKSTKSAVFNYRKPNFEELAKASQDKQNSLENLFEKSLLKVDELLRDIKEMKLKLVNQNLSNFEKSQFVNSIGEKQSDIEKLLDALKRENFEKNRLSNQLSNEQSELRRKQEEIENLLDNLLNDELKKLIEELNKAQLELQNQKNLTDKLELNYTELQKQLDRNLELLKRLEVEQNLEVIKDQLLEISENQREISEQIENGNFSDSLKVAHQNDISRMDQLQSFSDSTLSRNKELEQPVNLENFSEKLDDLSQDLKNDADSSSQSKSEKHKQNSEAAKKLADDLDKLLNKQNDEQQAENAESLRQILENLFYFSFEQEAIVEEFSSVSANNIKYSALVSRQYNLRQNFSIIRDSLYAVSKRTSHIGAHISKKVFGIDNKLVQIKDYLSLQNTGLARLEQRNILEYSNDLILLLSESLKNIENSMGGAGSSSNKNKKNKPAKGEPSASELRKSQESAKNQLEKMLNDLKKGKDGGSNPSSEQLAKMLAQQEIFQMMLMQLKQGSTISNEMLNKIDEINKLLEDNKRDLARKQLSSQTLNRQKQIVTRMLEIEKSENQREFDEERKSKEASVIENYYEKIEFEHEQDFINFEDIFKRSKLQLNTYYFNKYQDYLNKLKKTPNEKGN